VIPLFTLAHFGHHVLTALIVPLLPYIRGEFGLSYAQTGVLSAAFTIAYGIAQLPAGWLADRLGSRVLLTVGISGVAVAGALVGLTKGYWFLVAVFLLMGIFGGGYHPSASALISSNVPPARRGKALGLHIVGGSTSHFLAPLIAAGVVSLLGWRGTFVGLSVPVSLLGLLLWRLLRRHTQMSPEKPDGVRIKDTTPSDTERRRSVPHIVVFLVLSGAMGAVVASTVTFLPLLMVDHMGFRSELASALLAIIYSAGFFAAPLGGHLSDRFGQTRVMIITGAMIGPVVALFAIVPNLISVCVVLLVFGILMFTKMPTAEAYIAHAVPAKMRATVLGIYFFSGTEVSALLTPAIGSLIDAFGFKVGFLVVAGGMVCVAAVCTALFGVIRRS
jgi:MFS family permease